MFKHYGFFLLVLSLVLTGCNRDPYPSDGSIRLTERSEPRVPLPDLSLTVNDKLFSFEEGSLNEYKIQARYTGTPIVSIESLPEGASYEFDNETITLSWKPDYSTVRVTPSSPEGFRHHLITVWLRSAEDDLKATYAHVSMVVKNRPRPIKLKFTKKVGLVNEDITDLLEVSNLGGSTDEIVVIEEGTKWQANLTISSEDFKDGPFEVRHNVSAFSGTGVNASSIPLHGLKIVKQSNTEFVLTLAPSYSYVSSAKEVMTYSGKVIVHDPSNNFSEFRLAFNIKNKDVPPEIMLPKKFSFPSDSPNLNMTVVAYDPNEELIPRLKSLKIDHVSIKLDNSTTIKAFKESEDGCVSGGVIGEIKGDICLTEKSNDVNFSMALGISLKNVPLLGRSRASSNVVFEFCLGNRVCKEQSTTVFFEKTRYPAPLIKRFDWKKEETAYLKRGEEYFKEISVVTNDDYGKVVEIFPEHIRNYISWGTKEIDEETVIEGLKFNFPEEGIFNFTLMVTSSFGVSSLENFKVEVFPEDRKKNLLLFNSSIDNLENNFYKNSDFINPQASTITERDLFNRDTVVITTSALEDMSEETEQRILQAIDASSGNVVIASPLIADLSERLLSKLRTLVGGNVDIIALVDRPYLHKLEEWPLVTELTVGSAGPLALIGESEATVSLRGTTSIHSTEPSFFRINASNNGRLGTDDLDNLAGQDEKGATCTNTLFVNGIASKHGEFYSLGMVCRRQDGVDGLVSILGTEWADLNSSVLGLTEEWYNKMLNN